MVIQMAADIAANLAAVKGLIHAAARSAGRPAGSVELVAVAKTQPAGIVRAALEAGQRTFAENRVQEAAEKWPGLKADFPDARLHMVGPIQTNKARLAAELFDVIETVDRPKLARALAAGMEKAGRRPECFIQVNTGEEPQKGGVAPTGADAPTAACRVGPALPVTGPSSTPPAHPAPPVPGAYVRRSALESDTSKSRPRDPSGRVARGMSPPAPSGERALRQIDRLLDGASGEAQSVASRPIDFPTHIGGGGGDRCWPASEDEIE